MKIKRFSLSMLSILIAICCVVLSGILLFNNVNATIANAADVSSDGEVDYDEFTDSDTLRGRTNTIHEYASKLHHSTSSISNKSLSVSADDSIVVTRTSI